MYSTKEQQELYLSKVQQYVSQNFGDMLVKPIPKGVNVNFILGDPPKYFLKIGTRADLSVEKAGLEILKQHGIPVPKIIKYERKEPTIQKQILVLKYVEYNEKEPHNPIALGKTLKDIHAITGNGFGFISPETLEGTSSTWSGFLEYKTRLYQPLIEESIGKTVASMTPWIEELPEAQSFLHLDFAEDNILSKDKKVVAVIDPHGAYGHPLLDIAFTSIMTTEPSWMKSFMKGYAPNNLTIDELNQLRKYRIIAALEKYGIVLEGFKVQPERTKWWHQRKQRMETIIQSYLAGKDDPEFVASFL